MDVRCMAHRDLGAVAEILDGIELFPSQMLPEMAAAFLDGAEDAVWMVCDRGGAVDGFCYAQREALTKATWNMLALGVAASAQRSGVGRELVGGLQDVLVRLGARVVIVDTSSGDDFAGARAFYTREGYVEEARIRDFWGAGDDKVVFWKGLGG